MLSFAPLPGNMAPKFDRSPNGLETKINTDAKSCRSIAKGRITGSGKVKTNGERQQRMKRMLLAMESNYN